MADISYTISNSTELGTQIMVFAEGETYIARENHPSYEDISNVLHEHAQEKRPFTDEEAEELVRLFDVETEIRRRFARISDRVSLRGDTIHYEGVPLYNRLTETIVKFYKQNKDFGYLVAFLENLMLNPIEHSREQLYEFLELHDFVITRDGNFLAYKGLNDDFTSIHNGYGVVNGVEVANGNLDNSPGNFLEMPREKVTHDPTVACSFGFHAGTYEYASSFGRRVVLVEINPRDVASVPNDSNHQKIRCSRYEVVEEVENKLDEDEYYQQNVPDYVEDDAEDDFDDEWDAFWEDVEAAAQEDEYEEMRAEFIGLLQELASDYSYKGRVGRSYRAIAEREGLVEYLEVADDLDAEHTGQAVYANQIARLETD